MEIEVIKKIISSQMVKHGKFVSQAAEAEKYYRNENDIKRKSKPADKKGAENEAKAEDNPFRNADNRISHNWHQLLLDQKKAYALTYPPTLTWTIKALMIRL